MVYQLSDIIITVEIFGLLASTIHRSCQLHACLVRHTSIISVACLFGTCIHHKSKDACNLNQSVVKKLHSFVKLGSSCRRLKISISGEIGCFSPDNSQHKFYACALSERVYTPLKTSRFLSIFLVTQFVITPLPFKP